MNRLLVFTENHVRGGGNRYLIDSINGVALYFDQIVIASNPGGLYKEDLARLNSEVQLTETRLFSRDYSFNFTGFMNGFLKAVIIKLLKPLDPLLFIINLLNLLSLLKKVKPSVVMSCNGGYPAAYSTIAMILAARLRKIPCVMTVVSLPTKRSLLMYPYEWLLDNMVCRAADVIIVNAKSIEQELVKSRGFAENKIAVVYNGLEALDFKLSDKDGAEHNLSIGCIARMDRSKGVFPLLGAFAQLAGKYPELRLVLVGKGDASEELAHKVNELGLSERVSLTGYYDGDINELLVSFDIYVFPSLWEGFPYSILEAMRAGCAIVATRVGGIPEAIGNNEEGLLVPPGSENALAEAIEKLVHGREFCASLRINARQKFNEKFSLQVMHENLTRVFRSAGLLCPKNERSV